MCRAFGVHFFWPTLYIVVKDFYSKTSIRSTISNKTWSKWCGRYLSTTKTRCLKSSGTRMTWRAIETATAASHLSSQPTTLHHHSMTDIKYQIITSSFNDWHKIPDYFALFTELYKRFIKVKAVKYIFTYCIRAVTHAIASIECNVALGSANSQIHPVSAAGLRLILNEQMSTWSCIIWLYTCMIISVATSDNNYHLSLRHTAMTLKGLKLTLQQDLRN